MPMHNPTVMKQDENMIIPKPKFISTCLKVTKSILIILPISVGMNTGNQTICGFKCKYQIY